MLTQQVPSYLYQEYNDDQYVGSFFEAYNATAQQYLDDTNALQLPIYLNQQGDILDWCAWGIYGIQRTNLPVGGPRPFGDLNTFEANQEDLNGFKYITNSNQYVLSDLAYQRIVQWNTFKGDGYEFSIRWLKRRCERFLSGTIFTDQTYQISVRFLDHIHVQITIAPLLRHLVQSAEYNDSDYSDKMDYNGAISATQDLTPIALAPILQSGINAGVLQLPFQYTFSVVVL